jgi:hypothetical protein
MLCSNFQHVRPRSPFPRARPGALAQPIQGARRAARIAMARRENAITDPLNIGRQISQIAAQEGVNERRMRAIVRAIIAKRMPRRTLQAVDRVVRIVRELDRYFRQARAAGRSRDARTLGPWRFRLTHEMAGAGGRAESQ